MAGGSARSGGAPQAMIHLHDERFWRMLMRGSRGLAESYAQGMWDSPDLVAVIRVAARNAFVIDRVRSVTAPFWTPRQQLRALLRRGTRRQRRRTSPFTTTSATSCSSGCSIPR